MSGLTYQDYLPQHWSPSLAQIVVILSSMLIKLVFEILEHQADSYLAHNNHIQNHISSHLQREESARIVVLSSALGP